MPRSQPAFLQISSARKEQLNIPTCYLGKLEYFTHLNSSAIIQGIILLTWKASSIVRMLSSWFWDDALKIAPICCHPIWPPWNLYENATYFECDITWNLMLCTYDGRLFSKTKTVSLNWESSIHCIISMYRYIYIYIHTYTYIHIHIYIYICTYYVHNIIIFQRQAPSSHPRHQPSMAAIKLPCRPLRQELNAWPVVATRAGIPGSLHGWEIIGRSGDPWVGRWVSLEKSLGYHGIFIVVDTDLTGICIKPG